MHAIHRSRPGVSLLRVAVSVGRDTRPIDKRNLDGMAGDGDGGGGGGATATASATATLPGRDREGNRQRRVVSGLVSFTITVINDPLEARRRRTLNYVPDTGPCLIQATSHGYSRKRH